MSVSHTGFLLDGDDAPVSATGLAVTFELYTTSTGGSAAWSSSGCTLDVAGGYYAIVLGAGCNGTPALDDTHLPPGSPRWLELVIDGVRLAPRTRLDAAPGASVAARALTMTGGAISGGTIAGASISGGSVTGATISGGSISGATVSGGSISGTTISGGSITGAALDATSVAVGGSTVIAATGRLAGNARYTAASGGGLSVNATTQELSVRTDCATGEVLRFGGGVWSCATLDTPVQLQAATPGTAQVGHLNVSGTVRAGAFAGSGAGLTNLDGANVAAGSLPVTSIASGSGNVGKILTAQASGAAQWADAPAGSGGTTTVVSTAPESVVVLANTLGLSQHGGSTVANVWTTLALNTELVDTGGLVSLAGNTFTLPDGSYVVEAEQTVGSHVSTDMQFRVRLRNLTDGVTLATSTPCRAHIASGESTTFACPLRGAFTLAATKTIALEYWANRALADVGLGFGAQDTSNEPVRPTLLEIRRLPAVRCGAASSSAAQSCAAVRNCGLTASTTYWIAPDLTGPAAPFQAYCDLTTNGGGWMLILRDRLNEGGIVRPTALTWSSTTLGLPSGDADFLLAQPDMEAVPRLAINYQYLVVATGTGSTAGQYLTCVQDEPITKNGAPANGSCTFQDGSSNASGRRGISFHASGNCQNVSLWSDALNPGTWFQGSLHCETPSCSCGASWATTFPAGLGASAFGNPPGIPRTNNYSTWIYAR